MPNGLQQLLGQGPGGDPHGRLPRTGPLQHAANRTQVFEGAGQIAVSGPRPLKIVESLQLVVAVDHLQGDRAAQRGVLPDAAEDLDAIGLDPLPSAAAVAALAPPQLVVDRSRSRAARRLETHRRGPAWPCRATRLPSNSATSLAKHPAAAGLLSG